MASITSIALAEEGYLEKQKQYIKNNEILDSKTAGAGMDNVTKYWRDIYPSYQGKPWCQCFVVWCVVQLFGVQKAKNIMCCSIFTYSCGQQISFFKAKGKFKTKNPQPQDQVFFKDSKGKPCHTGLVYKVDNGKIYTIEGNTSSKSGVIANGGAVAKKSYSINYKKIYGYGVLIKQDEPQRKSDEEIAKEVIAGKWGTSTTKPTRKEQLEAAGYDYNTIQSLVNKMLK